MPVLKWGEETLVNTNVTGHQNDPNITVLAGGGYVICWTEADVIGGDGNGLSVKFQRFDALGNKVGGEVIANFDADGNQHNADIVATADGGFAIAWEDSTATDIEFRRFNANGTALDTSDQVLALADVQSSPALVTVGTGFAVAFVDDAGNNDIQVQRFLAGGAPNGTQIDVSPGTDDLEPAMAELAGGGFVVAWHDDITENIRVRGFDANGIEAFAIVDVDGVADTNVFAPSVTALANGSFVVAWQNENPIFPDTDSSIRARIVSSNGTLIGTEFTINTLTTGFQQTPSLAALPDGGFVAVYTSDADIRGQVFDAFGARKGGEFVVNTSTTQNQRQADVAALADGRFVVTWSEFGIDDPARDDPSGDAIRQQIFDPRDGVVTGTAAADTLFGNFVDDEINGLGGADTLNGLGGVDNLRGGDDNDTYIVGAGDTLFEFSGGGTDLVKAALSFTLGANVENLTLIGAAAINGTGNALVNVLTGNGAANVLAGGLGQDTLNGGLGNDTYVLDNGADTVIDTGGLDTVTSTISRSLASLPAVERLTLLGGAAIDGSGNGLANVLTGNAAANTLNGRGGADTMIGLAGNDLYIVDNALDTASEAGGAGIDTVVSTITSNLGAAARVIGAVEKLTLAGTAAINGTGNNLANVIAGNSAANVLSGGLGSDKLNGGGGNDTLIGGAGIDTLIGGANNDFFVFNTAPATNRDIVTDFNSVADTFRLDNAVFAALGGNGVLDPAFFHLGATAADADDHVIYNQATGVLIFDSNGNAGGGSVQIAVLTNKPALQANDFVVI
jgi:serralysin